MSWRDSLYAATGIRVLGNRNARSWPGCTGMDDLGARLAWAHGPERAAAILGGEDEDASADVSQWRNIGRGGDA